MPRAASPASSSSPIPRHGGGGWGGGGVGRGLGGLRTSPPTSLSQLSALGVGRHVVRTQAGDDAVVVVTSRTAAPRVSAAGDTAGDDAEVVGTLPVAGGGEVAVLNWVVLPLGGKDAVGGKAV